MAKRVALIFVILLPLIVAVVSCGSPVACASHADTATLANLAHSDHFASGTGPSATPSPCSPTPNPTQLALATQTALASSPAATDTSSKPGPKPTATPTVRTGPGTPTPTAGPPPPVVQITSPADGTIVTAGYSPFPVTLSGSVTPGGIGPLTWTDFRGRIGTFLNLGTGATITANLVVENLTNCGPSTHHTITLSVTDSLGRSADVTIALYLAPGCVH